MTIIIFVFVPDDPSFWAQLMTQQLIEAQEEAQMTESFAFSLGLAPSRTKERFENQQSNICQVGRASSSAAFSMSAGPINKSMCGKAANAPSRQNPAAKNGKSIYGKQLNGANGKPSSHGYTKFSPHAHRPLLTDFAQVKVEPSTSGVNGAGFGDGMEDGSLWRSPRVNKGNTHKYEDFSVPMSRGNGYIDGRKSPLFPSKRRRMEDVV